MSAITHVVYGAAAATGPVYGPLSAAITSGTGITQVGSPTTYAFPALTVTPSGGGGSYAYQWLVDGAPINATETPVVGSINAAAPGGTSATLNPFAYVGSSTGDNANGTLTCKVTDTVTGDTIVTSPGVYDSYTFIE